jgi:hypothetical protein
MTELHVEERAPSRSANVATFAILAALMWIAYRLDRRYTRWESRWLSEMSPLTWPRARAQRMRVGYRHRRADVGDFALLISTVMDDIAEARSRVNSREEMSRPRTADAIGSG